VTGVRTAPSRAPSRRSRLLALPLALPLALGACQSFEPDAREGHWRPTGANETNLRLMADRPEDLRRGRAEAMGARFDGHVAAAAVERQRAGQLRPLPEISTAPGLRGAGGP